jgi:hypothetical protein
LVHSKLVYLGNQFWQIYKQSDQEILPTCK